MSWFGKVFGGSAGKVVESVGKTAEVFVGNRADRERQYHDENMATKEQFAQEFIHVDNRTWWDSFIDGWNRLPRPLIVTMILASFPGSVWMVFNRPDEYKILLEAMAIIPNGMWALLSVVITFYFGGRMQIKAQAFHVKDEKLKEFEDSYSKYVSKKTIEEMAEKEVIASGNKTIDAFNERQH